MYKIAILGCENSHADSFFGIIAKQYPDVEVVGIYSDEPEAAKKLHETFGVPVADRPDAFVGKIDGLMITARSGSKHYPMAKPYLESGIPMFLDKPITANEAEAKPFLEDLRSHNIRISGGSSCAHGPLLQTVASAMNDTVCGGFVRAPLQSDSTYDGFWFYAQHGVQMTTGVFGLDIKRVYARRIGNTVNVMLFYDAYAVNLLYAENSYGYSVYLSKKGDTVCGNFPGNEWEMLSEIEFKKFYRLLQGEQQEQSYEEFFAPVYIMAAIERSLESGNEEDVAAWH